FRVSENTERFRRIAEKRRCLLLSGKYRRLSKDVSKLFSQPSYRCGFRAGDIEYFSRLGTVMKGPESHFVGISLPDYIHMTGIQINGSFFFYRFGNFHKHAVPEIISIVQTIN